MYIEVMRGERKGCRGFLTKQEGGVYVCVIGGKHIKSFGLLFDKDGNEYPITQHDFVFREIRKHESLERGM